MVEIEDELRTLARRPPVTPAPVEDIRRRARSRQRRRHAYSAAVVAIVAAIAVAVLSTRTNSESVQTVGLPPVQNPGTLPAPRDGRSTVIQLAEIAETRSPIPTAQNPVIHTRTESWTTTPRQPGPEHHQYEQWILGNGRRRLRYDTGGRVLPWGAHDWEWQDVPANAVSESKEVPIDRAPPGGIAQTNESLVRQSGDTDPTTGRALAPAAVGRVLDGIITANPAPPIQAGWFRELADVPGIQIEPQVTDHVGRTGIGLVIPAQDVGFPTTQTLIIDPTTATVLAMRSETTPTAGTTEPYQLSETDYYVEAVPDAPTASVHFS